MSRIMERARSISASSPFLRHVLTLMTGTAVAQVIVMALMMIITRLYGRDLLGELGTFNSVVAILVSVAALRYDLALMLERDDRNAKVLALMGIRIIVITSVVTTITAFLLRPLLLHYYTPAVARWMPLAGVSVLFLSTAVLLQFWFNRKTDYKTIAFNRVQQQVGSAGAQTLFGFARFIALPGLLFGQLVGHGFAFFNLLYRAKDLRTIDTTGAKTARQLARKHWRMPVLNGPNALVDAIRINGINLLIAKVSVGDLGEYTVAHQAVAAPVTLINSAVSQVFFQKLSTLPPGKMSGEVRRSIWRALVIGIGPLALLYLIAPWLLPFVFGAEFVQSGYFARALIPWMFMTLVTSPISTMFVVTGNQLMLLFFAIFYMVAPIGWLLYSPYELLTTIYILGAIMAACLVLMTLLAIYAAARYDRKAPPTDEPVLGDQSPAPAGEADSERLERTDDERRSEP